MRKREMILFHRAVIKHLVCIRIYSRGQTVMTITMHGSCTVPTFAQTAKTQCSKIQTDSAQLLTSSRSEHPKSQSGGSASRREHVMLMGGENNWLRKKKVLAYKGTPLHRLQLNSKEVWYKCILCNVMDRNPAQVRKHTLQVHHDLPRKFQCGHCGQSDEKVSLCEGRQVCRILAPRVWGMLGYGGGALTPVVVNGGVCADPSQC